MSSDTSGNNVVQGCECKAEDIVLMPCSGGSNCGQIANQAAIELTRQGKGRMYCLAGMGAHIKGMIESVKGARRVVAIDGCNVACAKKTIEHADLPVTDWICVTEEGIAKNKNFDLPAEQVELIARRTLESLSKAPSSAK